MKRKGNGRGVKGQKGEAQEEEWQEAMDEERP